MLFNQNAIQTISQMEQLDVTLLALVSGGINAIGALPPTDTSNLIPFPD